MKTMDKNEKIRKIYKIFDKSISLHQMHFNIFILEVCKKWYLVTTGVYYRHYLCSSPPVRYLLVKKT